MIRPVIEIMCDRHIRLAVDDICWPIDYAPGNSIPGPGERNCPGCVDVGDWVGAGEFGNDFADLDPDRQAAEHEAGHAVLHVLLGTTVIKASMQGHPDVPRSNAHVEFCDAEPFAQLVAAWGGYAANRHRMMLHGPLTDSIRVSLARVAAGDTDWIRANASPDEAEAAREQALVLVEEHWDDVQRVADALQRERELTGAQIEALVTRRLAGAR